MGTVLATPEMKRAQISRPCAKSEPYFTGNFGLVQLPGPIAMGSTAMLAFKALHQMPAIPGKGGGVYQSGPATQISADTNFYTDTTHTGTVAVTALDPMTMKFSGAFSFTAVNDSGTRTVNITDGVLTNVPFRVQ